MLPLLAGIVFVSLAAAAAIFAGPTKQNDTFKEVQTYVKREEKFTRVRRLHEQRARDLEGEKKRIQAELKRREEEMIKTEQKRREEMIKTEKKRREVIIMETELKRREKIIMETEQKRRRRVIVKEAVVVVRDSVVTELEKKREKER
ncbi:hypothetical protein Q9L58_006583 [Maublancomyces gigas]|uniref:Uncharacterized protein n=1 Tax=Discina gigas TaxID=1032678 RepID=A0ABR3GEU9_9PEZI